MTMVMDTGLLVGEPELPHRTAVTVVVEVTTT
jgi:hypothetical protein